MKNMLTIHIRCKVKEKKKHYCEAMPIDTENIPQNLKKQILWH